MKAVDTVAHRIQSALEFSGMKQADLSEKTGIGKSSISTYISGAYEPKQRNIYKIAKALNVSEAWLLGYDVPKERDDKIILGDELEKLIDDLSSEFPISSQALKSIFLGTDFSRYIPNGKIPITKSSLRKAFQCYFQKNSKDKITKNQDGSVSYESPAQEIGTFSIKVVDGVPKMFPVDADEDDTVDQDANISPSSENCTNFQIEKLSPDEMQILNNYRSLNENGQTAASAAIESMTYNPKYKK